MSAKEPAGTSLSNEGIVGVILAGGQSRRMGGGDKPLRLVAGCTLLERLIKRLNPQCSRIVVSANGDPSRFADFNLPVIGDLDGNQAGPLAGILAAMHWMTTEKPSATHLVSVPGDTPFIPHDLVARLENETILHSRQISVAASGGRMHPPIALWPVSLLADINHFLVKESQSRVAAFLSHHGIAEVEWPSEPYDPFFNINTPDDIDFATGLVAQGLVKD